MNGTIGENVEIVFCRGIVGVSRDVRISACSGVLSDGSVFLQGGVSSV